ncbi:hypothetical protein [Pontimicrobium sp. SW4]|uniref:TonB C-terminal domain-containing protein n=1 Tax=Pontimicrobium sp. SW4 TaxID=3153519 RepID=A0AAU7BQ03_9FLAO
MKKKVLIISAAVITISITVFSVMSFNNLKSNETTLIENNPVVMNTEVNNNMANRIFTDFIYDVGPRFNPIKKTDLDAIRSFNDLIDLEHVQRIVDYKSISVIKIIDDKESNIRETGNSNTLTNIQLEFIQASNYSTNLTFSAYLTEKNPETGAIENTHWSPYFTVVPEKQAEYSEGKDALKKYLKENSKAARDKANINPEKLQAAKLLFTVTKKGTIENIRLDRTSNYPLVDKTMIELIKNSPGTWKPAENFEGKKVDQELVVSFGLMGC